MGRNRRDRYPRINSDRKYKQGKGDNPPACAPCAKLGQDTPAVRDVRVEFTYMRGEDEFVRVCVEHLTELRDLINNKHKPWPKHFQGDDVWRD